MKKKILIRSGKDPFKIISPVESDKLDFFGNTGNLIYSTAVHKILSTKTTEVVSYGRHPDIKDADLINNTFDCFVLPMANSFRHRFVEQLNLWTALIQKLKIPVVVIGIGAQSDLNYSVDYLKAIDDDVKKFVTAVLKRSSSIGVRGEFTQLYLKHLGFNDVEVIGCPSMFMHGDILHIKKTDELSRESKISINASPAVDGFAPIFDFNVKKYKNSTYVAQDNIDLHLLLWGKHPDHLKPPKSSLIPNTASHFMYKEKRVALFLDYSTWVDFLSKQEFTFGTRIHGNIASILAGTPAVVIAHDSRTLELAKYFEIPYRLLPDLQHNIDASVLCSEANYKKMTNGHKGRFEKFSEFLKNNYLNHCFNQINDSSLFDEKMSKTKFPEVVRPISI